MDTKSILEKLSYYPNDVWLYLLSTQWQRIAQEEPFMGRCGYVVLTPGHAGFEQGEVVYEQRHAAKNSRIDVVAHITHSMTKSRIAKRSAKPLTAAPTA